MVAQSRSTEPLEGVKTHGAAGYDKGCGCLTCRGGNRDRKAKARVSATAERVNKTHGPAVSDDAGAFVGKTQAFIKEVGATGDEAELLAALMLFNAKLLDNIAVTGERWHLAGSAQKTLLDLKSQLRRLKDGGDGGKPAPTGDPKDELAGLLGGLTTQA